jgi:hypothetical protein
MNREHQLFATQKVARIIPAAKMLGGAAKTYYCHVIFTYIIFILELHIIFID